MKILGFFLCFSFALTYLFRSVDNLESQQLCPIVLPRQNGGLNLCRQPWLQCPVCLSQGSPCKHCPHVELQLLS